jgi:hypothetical protein
MKRTLLLATALVAASLMPHAAAAEPPDPCKMVSTADVGKALGTPVTSTTARHAGTCSFRTAAFTSLTITVVPQSSSAEAKSQYHDMVTNKLNYAAPSVDVLGLGDEAHRLGPMIYVLKGSTIYTFTMIGKDGNGAGAVRTIALARAGIAHVH